MLKDIAKAVKTRLVPGTKKIYRIEERDHVGRIEKFLVTYSVQTVNGQMYMFEEYAKRAIPITKDDLDKLETIFLKGTSEPDMSVKAPPCELVDKGFGSK